MKILNIVGARPTFMKVAPLHHALERAGHESLILHTGQHYDPQMSKVFFDDLGMPKPDVYLGVGSGSHAVQTAEVMRGFEPALLETKPDLVVVVGDVNSTVACSLVAIKLGFPVAHIEAGLRSFDRRMPEEINRLVTDAIADYLFVTEPSGLVNLAHEGVPTERVFMVGNLMIDSLVGHLEQARRLPIRREMGLADGRYAVATLHRPSNVDDPVAFGKLVDLLVGIAAEVPVVFPIHPRSRKQAEAFGLLDRLEASDIRLTGPLGYLEFLNLLDGSGLVVTDSGGIQEETTYLGVPCLTLRENTERPVTVEIGTNRLFGNDTAAAAQAAHDILRGEAKPGRIPDGWDGHAAERIVAILEQLLNRPADRG